MQQTSGKESSLGQPALIELDGHLLHVSQTRPNHVTISFDQLSRNLRHQLLNHQLSKVNYKTVISSLKGQHPQILSAKLLRNPDQIYVLSVKVKYEFLPQVVEQIYFQKRQLKESQMQEVGIKSMMGHLHNIKQQVAALSAVQVMTEQLRENYEFYFKLPHQKTLISWTLNLFKPSGNNIRLQMYNYNSAKKQKNSSKYVPDDGLYIHHNGNEVTVELRFIGEQSEKWDQVLLRVDGKWRGKSIVALQRL